ncbi:putative Na+-dependent transporter [Thermoplasmatales archaeon BRNA1]|nr:putative Na+-dependent transporter [Thermoplasmatales archaeon BRNA1]
MKALDLVCSTAFMMGAALVISLITNASGAFPDDVLNSDIRSNITVFLLAAMMCLTLSRIPFRNLNPVTNWKSVTKAVLLGLVFASVIPLAAYVILNQIPSYEKYANGLVFIAATPFAASVGPLSLILRGDLEHALRSTIIVYVVSLVWIPFIIWITLGELVDMFDVVLTVIKIIGIPLVVSRLLTKVKIDKTIMSVVLNCTIAFLVWLSVSATNFPKEMSILAVFIAVAGIRDFGLGTATEVTEKRAHIAWSTRVTDILMISYKNKGIAIALCVSLMKGPEIGNAMVAIAASIVIEVIWVAFMDSVLFSKKRMEKELAEDSREGIKQTWES